MSNLLDDQRYIKEEIEQLLHGLNPQEKAFFARQIKKGKTDISAITSSINDRYRDEESKLSAFEDLGAGLKDHLYVFRINLENFLTSGNLKVQSDRRDFVRKVIHNSIQGGPEDVDDNQLDQTHTKSKQLEIFTRPR